MRTLKRFVAVAGIAMIRKNRQRTLDLIRRKV